MLRTDVTFRRLTVADLDRCTALAADRGWAPEEEKWRFLLTVGEGYGIDDPDGRLAGAFVLTRHGPDLAAISMVLVAARYGRRGLGQRMMTHALEQAGGATTLLCATEIGRPVYERVGFTTVGSVTAHRGQYRPDPDLRVDVRPLRDGSTVAALDRDVFGADRAGLDRLPVFAERARVAADGTGYAASWRNGSTLMLGPVVAGDLDGARAVVDAVASGEPAPVRLDVPGHQPEFAAWVVERGLAPYFTVAFMVHGGKALPGDRSRLFALFMQALG